MKTAVSVRNTLVYRGLNSAATLAGPSVTSWLRRIGAADPLLATVLVGMGITSLSMALAAVRPVGARLAATAMDTCELAAEAALAAGDPMAARAAVRDVLSR